jgi:hypothetical protein
MSPNPPSVSVYCALPKKRYLETEPMNLCANFAYDSLQNMRTPLIEKLIFQNGIAYIKLHDSRSDNMEPPHKFQKSN